jgi:uncharacterized protein (DUF58 family)
MQASIAARRWWQGRDRPGWQNFGIAILALSASLLLALFSAAVEQDQLTTSMRGGASPQAGRLWLAGISAALSLALAGWVAVTIVPALARRTSLRWIKYQIDYRLTRAGVVYLGAVFVLILAAVNTGNNLLFMILSCLLAGILISGILSRAVLTGIEMKFDMPEHVFAEQPVLAELEIRNEKQAWPSFSLRVVGQNKKDSAQILTRPVFFPYIPRLTASRQKVELTFPRRGVYSQDAFGIQTRFPFGFFEKTRQVSSDVEMIVYPRVEPTDQFYEVLPLLSGEIASYFRGRGHELHSLREYLPTDSARIVDWKITARTGQLMVREFAREDERRVMLVLDRFLGPTREELGEMAAAEHAERFERAVSMAACIAWHFNEINSVMQFRTDRFSTPMAPASGIIYDTLRELALVEADPSTRGGAFLDDLASEHEVFKIILTSREQKTIPTSLWSSSYFIFLDRL